MPPGSPEIVFRAQNLSRVYRSGEADLAIFTDLNLDVRRGEMLALVGESGAGKSTLLHLLGGLDRPSNGTIYYGVKRFQDSRTRNRRIFVIGKLGSSGRFTTSCPSLRRRKT